MMEMCGLLQISDLDSPTSVVPATMFCSFLLSHALRTSSSTLCLGSAISFKILDNSPSRTQSRLSPIPGLVMSSYVLFFLLNLLYVASSRIARMIPCPLPNPPILQRFIHPPAISPSRWSTSSPPVPLREVEESPTQAKFSFKKCSVLLTLKYA